jgi:hypothetical protein
LNIFAAGIIVKLQRNFPTICFVEKIKSLHLQSVRNSGVLYVGLLSIKKHKKPM